MTEVVVEETIEVTKLQIGKENGEEQERSKVAKEDIVETSEVLINIKATQGKTRENSLAAVIAITREARILVEALVSQNTSEVRSIHKHQTLQRNMI